MRSSRLNEMHEPTQVESSSATRDEHGPPEILRQQELHRGAAQQDSENEDMHLEGETEARRGIEVAVRTAVSQVGEREGSVARAPSKEEERRHEHRDHDQRGDWHACVRPVLRVLLEARVEV